MEKMTKAERLFKENYFDAIKHIENWGVEYNPDGTMVSFNRIARDDFETVCARTLNAVEKYADQQDRFLNQLEAHKVRDLDYINLRRDAVKMVRATIEYNRKTLTK